VNISERNAVARSLQWMRELKRHNINCMQPLAIDDDIRMLLEGAIQELGDEELVAEAKRILESDSITFQEFSHFALRVHRADQSVVSNP